MTNAPTIARPEPTARDVAADVTTIDLAARGPLLLLLGSGVIWLVISGVLALITSIQLHSPRFLADYSFLTYGRTEAMRESAFIYGWAANAGLAIALWVLARLGGNRLRAGNWVFAGAVFWNTAVAAGMIGIAIGDLTTFSFFQLPRYVQPVMVIAYGAIAIAGVLAWMDRRREQTFAAQWYAAAALFLFPWLSTGAQIVLLWSPLRGVGQSVGAAWYAQGVWTLWLAPMALAGAYYLVPKVSGRTLSSYEFAPVAFWILMFAGAWTGARHLIGGPVPAWIVTIAVVASVVLLIHYITLLLNFRAAAGTSGTAAGFIKFGIAAYLLAGAVDTLMAFRGFAEETQFTFFGAAVEQLALYGGLSMLFFGAIYYMVPRLTGSGWASTGLTYGHRFLVKFAVVVLVITLAVAGWTQGSDLLDPKIPFIDIIEQLKLGLLLVSGAQLLLLGANTLLLVNFFQTITASVVEDVVALNPMQKETAS
jgi:cytochrome c oxidase cbb3-type subunit I